MFKYFAALICLTVSIAGCAERGPQSDSITSVLNPPDITRWAKPDTDVVALLSSEPNECLPPLSQSNDFQIVALGRMAFRSPFLLGGQATRRGLTCQACHSQGARNENFFVIGLSDAPGTADVSSFHFSDELGDETFNPSPIPSLSDDIRNIDYDPAKPDFEDFVTRLITKEFTGKNPSPEIKAALLTYLRTLDDSHCEAAILTRRDLLAYNVEVIAQTFETLGQNNFTGATQNFLTAALRIELGRLHSRFPYTQDVQTGLAAISQSLNSRGADITEPQIIEAAAQWQALAPKIMNYYETSLFHPETIEKWAR